MTTTSTASDSTVTKPALLCLYTVHTKTTTAPTTTAKTATEDLQLAQLLLELLHTTT